MFQSTHPGRGATTFAHQSERQKRFNPRTPGGVRHSGDCYCRPNKRFQSTHPGRGATLMGSFGSNLSLFQSTHPGRGATCLSLRVLSLCSFNPRTPGGVRLEKVYFYSTRREVSIHAPRAGCDSLLGLGELPEIVSIHAPRAGCDAFNTRYHISYASFNPRTPGGVRPSIWVVRCSINEFQSTHPGRGATPEVSPVGATIDAFQSTHPGRGATAPRPRPTISPSVSIHAPRAGCDKIKKRRHHTTNCFNPRTPGGVRQVVGDDCQD